MRALSEAVRAAAAEASGEGGATAVFLAAERAAASMSSATMRLPGPVPVMVERSMWRSSASLRASGETLMRAEASGASGAAIGGAKGVGAGRLGMGEAASVMATAAAGAGGGVGVVAATGPETLAAMPLRMARMQPMLAFCPSSTRMSVRIPSSKASISMVALSVSISARTSPISTVSPTFLCHLMRVPSVMVSESFGISIFTGIASMGRVALKG